MHWRTCSRCWQVTLSLPEFPKKQCMLSTCNGHCAIHAHETKKRGYLEPLQCGKRYIYIQMYSDHSAIYKTGDVTKYIVILLVIMMNIYGLMTVISSFYVLTQTSPSPHPVLTQTSPSPHPVLTQTSPSPHTVLAHPFLTHFSDSLHPVLTHFSLSPHPVLRQSSPSPHPVYSR